MLYLSLVYELYWFFKTECLPSSFSVTDITPTSAKLTWNAVTGAEGYNIRYKVSGTGRWTKKDASSNSKTIGGLSTNTKYSWQVRTLCEVSPNGNVLSGWSAKQTFTTDVLHMGDESSQQASLQIYPNPAEDFATIQLTLQQPSRVSVNVYDVSGKEILVLMDDDLHQGEHSLQLNTSQFSKGVYFVKMISDWSVGNKKLVVE